MFMFPKRFFALTLFAALAVMPTRVLRAQWVQTNGLGEGSVTSIAFMDTSIFVTTRNGTFRSTNNGSNWTACAVPIITMFQLTPRVGSLAVIGTKLFEEAAIGPLLHDDDSTGIFRSDDNGASWTAINSGIPLPASFGPLTIIGSNLFLGVNNEGIYMLNDSETSWINVSKGLKGAGYDYSIGINCLTVSGNTLFCGDQYGISFSTNNGTSWVWDSTSLANQNVVSITVIGNDLFAAIDSQGNSGCAVFFSTDAGYSWVQASSISLPNTYITSLAVSGTNLLCSDP